MENMNFGEQPIVQDHSADAQNVNGVEKKEDSGFNVTCGSQYGKFKDAKSLLEAYSSLEKEFTRKSQELAKLKSDTFNENSALGLKNNMSVSKGEEKSNLPSQEQQASPTYNGKSASENGDELIYKKSDWKSLVIDFFRNNPEAKPYAKQMSKAILDNPCIAKSGDCLKIAYKLSLSDKFQEPAELSKSEDFLKKYIVGNKRAEDLIINNYINSLKIRSIPPEIISGQSSNLVVTPPKKYASLKEAGDVLKNMFN